MAESLKHLPTVELTVPDDIVLQEECLPTRVMFTIFMCHSLLFPQIDVTVELVEENSDSLPVSTTGILFCNPDNPENVTYYLATDDPPLLIGTDNQGRVTSLTVRDVPFP